MWGDRRGGGVGFFMYGFSGFDVHQYKHKYELVIKAFG